MSCKGKKAYVFSNWSHTHSCEPELYFEPSNVEAIREILQLAKKNHKQIKVIGKGLSPSDIACTNGYMVSLTNFNNVLDVDTDHHTITVESGITIEELNNQVLPANGLAFRLLGSVSGQSIGGIIGTGTHGTGKDFGSFASCVLEITMMKADGSIVHCSKTENEELLLAASCHLGILGVILSVKLQCEPSFMLYERKEPCTLQTVLKNLDEFIDSAEHFRLLWFPHTDYALAVMNNRSNKSAVNASNWFWDIFVGNYVLELCLWISTFFPIIIPLINKIFFKLCCSSRSEHVQRSDRVFNIDCLFKQHVTEWAVPRKHTSKMLNAMKDWLTSHPHVKAHFPVEVRFVKKDNIMMAPSCDEDVTYIGIISYRPYGKDVPHKEWWSFFETTALQHGGKPHWAKAHKVTASSLRQIYRNYDRFMTIRKQLDPDSLFLNDYWKRIIDDEPLA